ncbi:hypothetical protein F9L33_05360 [Amylibacter sp. SFDW26]|uniref:TFIIB-type zinc ribbon-containing protein n=1 Tax=Amylibacter sp. SFDW26 TaxID=2652722 RepID=UPI001261F840|nr:zf-TFIIB domain-containing protein [Amylibacter sp. SFDW26]KAB7616179.1 hypothetical protein F9L33_05360 [Amylibacter sp. SFDW26]
MKCPVDNETLVITTRGDVEIDYCPQCRGVWLDRGELDKIIERSAQPIPTYKEGRGDYSRKPKKKSSILSELFDF